MRDDENGGGFSDQQDRIQMELHEQRRRLEQILKQKSRELWLQDGDNNSYFFFASTLVSRRQNRVLAIQKHNGWITNHKEIAGYFLDEFRKLYMSSVPHYPNSLTEISQQYISNLENKELMAILSEQEIWRSV